MSPSRRDLLRWSVALPLGAGLSLAACEKVDADHPRKIRYGREMCEHCAMLVSEPRFAAQLWDPTRKSFHVFDDIGCAAVFSVEQKLADAPEAKLWVADYDAEGQWLDGRAAHYRTGMRSPMGYGFAATKAAAPDRIPLAEMRQRAVANAHCAPPAGEAARGG